MRTDPARSCAKAIAIRFMNIQLHRRQTVPNTYMTSPLLANQSKFINRFGGRSITRGNRSLRFSIAVSKLPRLLGSSASHCTQLTNGARS
jgi:hypothetical protein